MSHIYRGKGQGPKKRPLWPFVLPVVLLLCLGGGIFLFLHFGAQNQNGGTPSSGEASLPESQSAAPGASGSESAEESPAPTTAPGAENLYAAMPLPEEMRAMWISFLEWQMVDFSTEDTARAAIGEMFSQCQNLGLNTVIVAVRPFGDALYPSEIFPWSHLLTGQQGQDPGYDPLAMMVEEAHSRGLRIEAWINPYRVQHPVHGPAVLSADNPAALNPEWVKEQTGLWYDPGLPEVQQLLVDGVVEIVENYEVDGIHFDDYFYPDGNTPAFDAESYALYGQGQELAAWRRDNVNTLMRDVYAAIKQANPTVSFGVSPQGNNENNYNTQHSDVRLWMETEGYVDYVMPQLYWGFDYVRAGSTTAAFANKVAEWSSYTLAENVRLYCGLGAYRIGVGDGGDGDMAEWNTGHNLADMVLYLRENGSFSGFSLFRQAFLFAPYDGEAWPELAQAEVDALAPLLQ